MFSRFWSFVAQLVSLLTLAASARAADDRDVWVLPTQANEASGAPVDLGPLARRLDLVLQEAVRDFGMTPRLGEPPIAARDEPSLTELAGEASVLSPEI